MAPSPRAASVAASRGPPLIQRARMSAIEGRPSRGKPCCLGAALSSLGCKPADTRGRELEFSETADLEQLKVEPRIPHLVRSGPA